MKLIKVDYIEESSTAIFFNVTFESKPFFGKTKTETKRAFLEKWKNSRGGWDYPNNFKWTDNSYNTDSFSTAVIEEMILQQQKINKCSR